MVKSLASEVGKLSFCLAISSLFKVDCTLAKVKVIKARATTNLKPTTFVLPSIILKLKPKNVGSKSC